MGLAHEALPEQGDSEFAGHLRSFQIAFALPRRRVPAENASLLHRFEREQARQRGL
jgi:hypothetical protein